MVDTKINILGREYSLVRLKLKEWTQLEPLKKQLEIAISKNDYQTMFEIMVKVIEMAILPSGQISWIEIPWYDFLGIYYLVLQINAPTIQFPILNSNQREEKKLPWEYEGRSWYFWLNLFAKNYGWREEVIANLDIDTAIGAYQEIAIDEQLQKEWEWGLSEVTYSYDKNTKKSKHTPLQRPTWMHPIIPKQLPVVRMKKSHLPVGNVIDVQEEFKNKATKSA